MHLLRTQAKVSTLLRTQAKVTTSAIIRCAIQACINNNNNNT